MPIKSIKLYFQGDAYFDDLFLAIESSSEEILIETYVFDYDPIGIRLIELLSKAQARGVRVFLCVDGIGAFYWMKPLIRECAARSVPLVVYRPLKIPFRLGWNLMFRLIKFFKVINRRNHRKIVLIDKKIVFVGSFNITQVHSERCLGPQAWRDTAVGIELSENPHLEMEFKMLRSTMYRTLRKFLPPKRRSELPFVPRADYHPKKSLFRLNSKLKWRAYLYQDLKKRIHRSEKRILITNAYFVPKLSLIRILCRAAKRGVFVGIVLPKSSDVWLVRMASRRLYGILLNNGVHLYEYKKSNLHAKTMVIDDWATVGSHNLNHRSFIHDLELEVALSEPNHVQKLLLQWDLDLRDSEPLTIKNFKDSYFQTFLSYVLYTFLRYWL